MQNAGKNTPPLIVWITCAPGDEEEILAGIEDGLAGAHIPIIGGSSADNAVEGKWYQITNGQVLHNGVVVTAMYPSKPIRYAFDNSYTPPARTGIITKASGRTVYKIDHRPAAEVYNEWTNGIIADYLDGGNILPPFIVFSITRERPSAELPPPLAPGDALRKTLSNQPFRMVMGLYLLSWTTASIVAATLIYFANYYLQIPDQANYLVLAAQGSAILFIPAVVWLCRRLDKRRAFILGALAWMIVLLAISALPADQVALAYVLAALAGFGIATAYVVPWAMVPDVVEYDQVRSGQRREGSYYAFASFFQKLATGAALWGMGQTLARTGYLTPGVGPPYAGAACRRGDGDPHLHRPRPGGAAVPGRAVCVEVSDHAREPSGDVAGTGGAGGIGVIYS